VAVTGVNGGVIEVITPCGNPATLTEGTPIYEVDVVIDPGHGGPIDTGAVARTGLAEKDINLQVGLAVQGFLADRGISALLTRTADYPIPIRTRSEYSDMVGARALVSIHHNAPAAPASEIPGVEIFVQDGKPESARLGGLIHDDAMATLGRFDIDWDRAPDAGVMTVLNGEGIDAYGMVRLPDAPSALVELGYMANPAEADLFADPAYVPSVAQSVARAIEAFLMTEESGAPLVEGRNFNPARGVGRDQCIEPHLDEPLYPDVVEASVTGGASAYNFVVTVSSPYDTPERYADAWRVVGDDGVVYGAMELAHDHAGEQPFTRALAGVEIPATVRSVTIQARDLVYGWGGGTVELNLR
jgi:N-acetylmuramoyl-L-alanine amidase